MIHATYPSRRTLFAPRPSTGDVAAQAAREALQMSGWVARTEVEKNRAGVAIGSGIGMGESRVDTYRMVEGVNHLPGFRESGARSVVLGVYFSFCSVLRIFFSRPAEIAVVFAALATLPTPRNISSRIPGCSECVRVWGTDGLYQSASGSMV